MSNGDQPPGSGAVVVEVKWLDKHGEVGGTTSIKINCGHTPPEEVFAKVVEEVNEVKKQYEKEQ